MENEGEESKRFSKKKYCEQRKKGESAIDAPEHGRSNGKYIWLDEHRKKKKSAAQGMCTWVLRKMGSFSDVD